MKEKKLAAEIFFIIYQFVRTNNYHQIICLAASIYYLKIYFLIGFRLLLSTKSCFNHTQSATITINGIDHFSFIF